MGGGTSKNPAPKRCPERDLLLSEESGMVTRLTWRLVGRAKRFTLWNAEKSQRSYPGSVTLVTNQQHQHHGRKSSGEPTACHRAQVRG